jgi:hypothetical protein
MKNNTRDNQNTVWTLIKWLDLSLLTNGQTQHLRVTQKTLLDEQQITSSHN